MQNLKSYNKDPNFKKKESHFQVIWDSVAEIFKLASVSV